MPYYNSFQQSYQPYQQSFQPNLQMQPPMQQNASSGSGILWVQGDVGARAFPVGAGSSVILMDSEAQNFYIKSADASGMPTMKKYSYVEVIEEPLKLTSHDAGNMASKDDVKVIHDEINAIKNQIANMEVNMRNATGGNQNVQPTV